MPSLTEVAALSSALAVGVAVLFGTLTIRQWKRTRMLTAAAELVHTLLTPDFTRAIAHLVDLPEGAEPGDIAARPGLPEDVVVVSHVFESLGVLVFHRLLPLHLVDHLVGGYVRAAWKRAGPYIIGRRAVIGVAFGEWFQWLAARMNEDPAPGKGDGAHRSHRSWKRARES
jgi:hypothetical protein